MNDIHDMESLTRLASAVGGVFSHGELSALYGIASPVLLNRKINRFVQAGVLRRFCRGIYICTSFNAEVLAQKVRPSSYLSLGTALAKHRMIGTEPRHQVFSISTQPAAEFAGPPVLSYSKLDSSLMMGILIHNLGIRIADPAKALLDTLYFYQKGHRLFFQLYQDVDTSIVDREAYARYLAAYKNPRFQTFAQRYIDGQFQID